MEHKKGVENVVIAIILCEILFNIQDSLDLLLHRKKEIFSSLSFFICNWRFFSIALFRGKTESGEKGSKTES